MSDMTSSQKIFYTIFLDTVKELNAAQVAVLLYVYPFICDHLEKEIPDTDELTPFMYADSKNANALGNVLLAFGAQPFSSSGTLLTVDISSKEFANILEKDPIQFKNEIIKKYNLDIIHQLFILTGYPPINCDRTINMIKERGPHLRFVFLDEGKNDKEKFNYVRMALKLFNIDYCDGLSIPSKKEYYITIAPDQYPLINQYFNPQPQGEIQQKTIDFNALTNEEKLILSNMLLSPDNLRRLKDRNNNPKYRSELERYNHEFSLEGIMLQFVKFSMHNILAFNYLVEKGHTFEHCSPLKPEVMINVINEENPRVRIKEKKEPLCFSFEQLSLTNNTNNTNNQTETPSDQSKRSSFSIKY